MIYSDEISQQNSQILQVLRLGASELHRRDGINKRSTGYDWIPRGPSKQKTTSIDNRNISSKLQTCLLRRKSIVKCPSQHLKPHLDYLDFGRYSEYDLTQFLEGLVEKKEGGSCQPLKSLTFPHRERFPHGVCAKLTEDTTETAANAVCHLTWANELPSGYD